MRPLSQVPNQAPFDEFTISLIARKARKLARGKGYSRDDQEDLEQELLVKLILASKRYKAERGHWRSFVTAVVERQSASLARRGVAQKHNPQRVRSLNVAVGSRTGHSTEFSALVEDSVHDRRLGRETRSPQALIDIRIAIEECTADLSTEQRDLCERLKYVSKAQVAVDLGIARSTVQSRLPEIYDCFAQHGLRDYLQNSSSKSAAT